MNHSKNRTTTKKKKDKKLQTKTFHLAHSYSFVQEWVLEYSTQFHTPCRAH